MCAPSSPPALCHGRAAHTCHVAFETGRSLAVPFSAVGCFPYFFRLGVGRRVAIRKVTEEDG